VSGYTFTNKVDIWAFGCIVYELMARKQAFSGDFSVLQYSSFSTEFELPDFPSAYSRKSKCILGQLINSTLEVDETRRPSAKSTPKR
jgi:serine/threonine protein kinase